MPLFAALLPRAMKPCFRPFLPARRLELEAFAFRFPDSVSYFFRTVRPSRDFALFLRAPEVSLSGGTGPFGRLQRLRSSSSFDAKGSRKINGFETLLQSEEGPEKPPGKCPEITRCRPT